MQPLDKQAHELQSELVATLERIKIKALEAKLAGLNTKAADPALWQDQPAAQQLLKEQASLENRIKAWRNLENKLSEVVELLGTKDESMLSELTKQLNDLKTDYDNLKKELLFNEPYDDHNVILSIYAGAGGTDAQDWTQMLLRMYSRWAENQKLQTKTIDESAGEEAGLKSVTIEVDGPFVYGKLKGEQGVHRLVRLSPFNADNLRQTSFAKVEVLPKIDSPEEVHIDDKDLKVDVYRSGGKGGQSVNTTDSAVRITHLPTNITVAIQNERSQLQNKETAMAILRSKLAQLQQEQHLEDLSQLKGPNQSAEWGNQIRSYVLHPYKQVKDLRSKHETSAANEVLNGQIDEFITAYLEHITTS